MFHCIKPKLSGLMWKKYLESGEMKDQHQSGHRDISTLHAGVAAAASCTCADFKGHWICQIMNILVSPLTHPQCCSSLHHTSTHAKSKSMAQVAQRNL